MKIFQITARLCLYYTICVRMCARTHMLIAHQHKLHNHVGKNNDFQAQSRLTVNLGNVTKVNDLSYGFDVDPAVLPSMELDTVSIPFQASIPA